MQGRRGKAWREGSQKVLWHQSGRGIEAHGRSGRGTEQQRWQCQPRRKDKVGGLDDHAMTYSWLCDLGHIIKPHSSSGPIMMLWES